MADRHSCRQFDDRLLRVAPEETDDLSNRMNLLGAAFQGNALTQRRACRPIATQADLDQFVMIEREFDLTHHVLGQATVGDRNDRVQLMTEAAKELALAG